MSAARFEPIIPEGFNATIGPVEKRQGSKPGDQDRFRVALKPHLLNGAHMAHGGFMMSVADIVMGYTVHEVIEGAKATTVSLNCDFVAGAKGDETITATATVTRRTRSLVFISGELKAGGRTVLTATGIWKVLNAA